MINTRKLVGIIAENGKSKCGFAKEIGMKSATFNRKIKQGVFSSEEIEKMILTLNIQNPMEIFFTEVVTSQVTND